jgi:hypothetical protein
MLQVSPVGQSLGPLQPHTRVTWHVWPLDEPVQSTQMPPLPQSTLVVPATQVLLPASQQLLLQLVWLASPHAVSHWCVVVLHALPVGH